MEVPSEMTIEDVSGKWTLNKQLSDPLDGFLALQGVPALLRSVSKYVNVELVLSMKPDEKEEGSPIRVHHKSTVSSLGIVNLTPLKMLGLMKERDESQLINNKPFIQADPIIGKVEGRMSFKSVSSLLPPSGLDLSPPFSAEDVEYLTAGLKGKKPEEKVVVMSLKGEEKRFRAEHVWGFEEVEGQRRNVRRIVVRSGEGEEGKVERLRMVYTYLGKV